MKQYMKEIKLAVSRFSKLVTSISIFKQFVNE